MDRKALQEDILRSFASLLTIEKFKGFKAHVEGLSDYEFFQVIAEANETADASGLSEHACAHASLHASIEAIKNGNIDYSSTAMHSIYVRFMDEDSNNALLERLSKSKPSDVVNLDRASDLALIRLWEDSAKRLLPSKGVMIPSDLFFAGTVPLLDFHIVIDERGEEYPDGQIVNYRVVVFEDYLDIIQAANGNNAIVGVIVRDYEISGGALLPIVVVEGIDYLVMGPIGYANMSPKHREFVESSIPVQDVARTVIALMETWYGIQIALLHPQVKEVFLNPKTVVDSVISGKSSKKKKNKVKYIKKHIINKDELEVLIYGDEPKSLRRHTLAWYVIGHWRATQNGRKTFVRPHWKGALRHAKIINVERERVIAQASGE